MARRQAISTMNYPHLPDFNPQSSLRVLIVRLSAHGDVMHTLPLLSAIKRQYPNASVGWLVEASAAFLLENHPLIEYLHVSQRKRWLKLAKNPLNWLTVWQEVRAFLGQIRASGYQISFDVQGLLKSAIWPFLAKIPLRYGYKATRENADWLYNRKLPPMVIRDAHTPAVQRYLDFARAIGCEAEQPVFVVPPVSEAVEAKVSGLLAELPNPEWPLVVLAPFTRWPSKHWPLDYWGQLLPELLQLNVRVALLGAPGDQPATDQILSLVTEGRERVLNLVGRTSWPDLYALFSQTRLLIGLDSAPLHIANAVGVPELIGIYGPTAPGRTGPIGPKSSVLVTQLSCQPCYERNCPIQTHDCMKQLTPDQILAIVKTRLDQAAVLP